MRMAHDLRNRQYRCCWHALIIKQRQGCIPIREGLQPALNDLDQNFLVAEPLTDTTKPRIISQFWLPHRPRQPSPLVIESRHNRDISLRRTEDSTRHETRMMRPTSRRHKLTLAGTVNLQAEVMHMN